jgi:hypothetical protein
MPKAIVDPAELHRFAASLGGIVGILRDRRNAVNGEFKALHEAWRDKQYEQFERSFSEMIERFNRFTDESERYAKYLRGKARKAEAYLQGDYGR